MADGKSQMDRMEDMLTQLIRIVGKTNEGVMELRGSVKELQTGQTELRTSVAELQNGQAELRSSVAELQTGQAELKDELTETKNVVFRMEHRLQVME